MSAEFTMDNPLATYKDLARLTNIPIGTLRNMVKRNEIPCLKIGPRSPRFLLKDCESDLSIPKWLRTLAVLPKKGGNDGK